MRQHSARPWHPALLVLLLGCSTETTVTGTGGNGGDAGSAGSGANTGGTGGNTDGGVTLDCNTYCNRMADNCSEVVQYPSRAACEGVCAAFNEGSLQDDGGENTLGCRIYHAGLAAVDNPNVHCPHAGPTGANMCGSNCQGYCQLMLGICPDTYENNVACEEACEAFDDREVTNFRYATPSDTHSPLFCRVRQALVAAEAAPNTANRMQQCALAGFDSTACAPAGGGAGAGGTAGSGG